MNRIANLTKGISDFVDALTQENRDDERSDENVRNEDVLHSHEVHDALSKASSKIASFIGKIVGGEVAKFIKDEKFQELPAENIDDVIADFEYSRIPFLHDECMVSIGECDEIKDIIKLEDYVFDDKGSIFCSRARYLKDVPVELARKNGFILPSDIDDKLRNNENLKIRPLMIHCYGVGSSNLVAQLAEAVCNGFGINTGSAEHATKLVEDFIRKENEKNKDQNVIIVPYITGFSLGGMFASTIATKLNYGSCIFNPWRMGSALCEFVGEDAWNLANRQKDQHLIFSTKFDFTSSSASPLSYFVKSPGRRIIMENIGLGDHFHPVETHTKYRDVFQHHIEKRQQEMLSSDDEKVSEKKPEPC